MLGNPQLLIRPFARREAVSSSRIEGTVTNERELVLFEVAPDCRTRDEVREVRNYVSAFDHGLARLKELPVGLRLIRETHGVLMQGVRGGDKRPGEFRKTQNYIAKPNQKISEARFVPPPVTEMEPALADLERFLNSPTDLPFLVQLALIHYQFEAIHPFEDGNGRVGRLLVPFLLCERNKLSQPLLYLSSYLEREREQYADLLLRVSQSGEWVPWIQFVLKGVAEQSKDASVRVERLTNLQKRYREKLQSTGRSSRALALLDELFAWPATTVVLAQNHLGVTYRSARLTVDKLISAGILQEHPGRTYNRVYLAREIISISEADFAGASEK